MHVCLNKTYKCKVGDPKALFLLATTTMCMGGCFFIPCIAPLYLRSVPYDAECY